MYIRGLSLGIEYLDHNLVKWIPTAILSDIFETQRAQAEGS